MSNQTEPKTEMELYGAIDLHSNNNVTVLIDEQDRVVYQKRMPNDLPLMIQAYRESLRHRESIQLVLAGGRAESVESANTAAYEGLKYTDESDAHWLAHLLRLGGRTHLLRDLLRKRGQMVRQRTANLSIQNLFIDETASKHSIAKRSTISCPMAIWLWRSRPT